MNQCSVTFGSKCTLRPPSFSIYPSFSLSRARSSTGNAFNWCISTLTLSHSKMGHENDSATRRVKYILNANRRMVCVCNIRANRMQIRPKTNRQCCIESRNQLWFSVTSRILSFSTGFMCLIIWFDCTHQAHIPHENWIRSGWLWCNATRLAYAVRTSSNINHNKRKCVCRPGTNNIRIKLLRISHGCAWTPSLNQTYHYLMTKAIQFLYLFYSIRCELHLVGWFRCRHSNGHRITYEWSPRLCNGPYRTHESAPFLPGTAFPSRTLCQKRWLHI